MASGLLVAGTGASLAIAAPDSGSGTDGTGPTSDPAPTDTSGVLVPTGVTIGPGASGGVPKPSSSVGDGRNGLPTGVTTGTVTATESTHSSETTPTTGVTESSSKLSESVSTSAPETASASPSEQGSGVTTRVSIDPTVAAAGLPQPLVAALGAEDQVAETSTTETTTTGAPELGWPWSWWNWYPQNPTGGGGAGVPAPSIEWQSPFPPNMQLPQFPTIPRELVPQLPGVSFDPLIDAINGVVTGVNTAVSGLATAASQLPFAQITLPVIVIPGADTAAGAGGGNGTAGAGEPGVAPRPGIPAEPNPPVTTYGGSSTPAPPPSDKQKSAPPAFSASNNALPPPSYRMGYVEYLRAAGFGEVAAVALPGFTGILILTGAGGLIGYRQARAGRSVRAGNTARFMG
jgi:hypothetical protein